VNSSHVSVGSPQAAGVHEVGGSGSHEWQSGRMERAEVSPTDVAKILRSQLRISGNFAGLALKFSADHSHILKAATLEAALARFRLLIDFAASRPLTGAQSRKPRHPGDLDPRDLGIENWIPRLTPNIDWDLFDIDKFVVHLTRNRLDLLAGRFWNPQSMLTSILDLYDQLADEVDRVGNTDAAQLIRDGMQDGWKYFNSPTIELAQ
jgi:hypothetical protein